MSYSTQMIAWPKHCIFVIWTDIQRNVVGQVDRIKLMALWQNVADRQIQLKSQELQNKKNYTGVKQTIELLSSC